MGKIIVIIIRGAAGDANILLFDSMVVMQMYLLCENPLNCTLAICLILCMCAKLQLKNILNYLSLRILKLKLKLNFWGIRWITFILSQLGKYHWTLIVFDFQGMWRINQEKGHQKIKKKKVIGGGVEDVYLWDYSVALYVLKEISRMEPAVDQVNCPSNSFSFGSLGRVDVAKGKNQKYQILTITIVQNLYTNNQNVNSTLILMNTE